MSSQSRCVTQIERFDIYENLSEMWRMNGNGNNKCFNCGADLPVTVETPNPVEPTAAPVQSTSPTPTAAAVNSHSAAIKNMAAAVIVISIIVGLIFGFMYGSFNWILSATFIVFGLLFAVILFALAHIAEAQEETTKALLKLIENDK